MLKIIYFITFIFLFFSCKPLSKISVGVKNPKFKENSEIYHFAKKHDVELNSLFYFENWDMMKKVLKAKYSSIPNAYFFNKYGNYVNYRKTSSDCNAKVDEFIDNLEAFSTFPSDSLRNINQILPLIINDKKVELKQNEITVLISWATFMGKVNDDKAFKWIILLEKAKQKGIKLEYYLINYDLHKSWNLSNEEKKEIENLFKIF